MKIFLLTTTLLFFTASLSSDELAWVDEQIKAIKPSRVGLKNSSVSAMKDPFIFLKKYRKEISITKIAATPSLNKISSSQTENKAIVVKKSKKLSLSAVMNHSALINETWYKKGDVINGYTLFEVNKKSVLLTKKSKKLILSTQSINKNLNFKNK